MALFNRKKSENFTQEEENMRRKSAPRPTMQEAAIEEAQKQKDRLLSQSENSPLRGNSALNMTVNEKVLHEYTNILQKYKQGKANLEQRIVDNERWYKLRHWESMRKDSKETVEPVSAWLFNCLANKHADAMDNFPSPNVLPREEGDRAEAERLSSIIPVILDECDFEQTYSDAWEYKLKSGTGVYGVFWDSSALNGLGQVAIKSLDLLNIFWEPGIKDIQDSKYLFTTELVDNEALAKRYPQLGTKLGGKSITVTEYVYDDTVDTTNMSVVIDVYRKAVNSQGKQILHYCKYVGDTVLFATENDPNFVETGLYAHGRYPIHFDPLFRTEGTPAGFGYIDIGKSAQEYIDRLNQAIMKNSLANIKPRFFVRDDGAVNEAEYADETNDFVHVKGSLNQDAILPIEGKQLGGIYVDVYNSKIEEMKEVTGTRDVTTGGTPSGITAASAIAALQEQGSKLSRDHNKAAYRVFKNICLDVIELIRQFYDLPRSFRIMGSAGTYRFIQYSNEALAAQPQTDEWGNGMGVRIPLFDLEITAQKASPYSKMSQNELALQFYQLGFFNPNAAEQALLCLDMMDFDRKDAIVQKIQQNSTMLQQMMMLAQMVDMQHGNNAVSAALAQQYGMAAPIGAMPASGADNNNVLGGSEKTSEPKNTRESRQRVAESTAPN